MLDSKITVSPVNAGNWRSVAKLKVHEHQTEFVAEPSYYLALCCYDSWNPLAIQLSETVVGFMMWGIDGDESCWLGGILIDKAQQQKGYGRKAVEAAVKMLQVETGATEFALSYEEGNGVARALYRSIGFIETGELEDDEIVARMKVS